MQMSMPNPISIDPEIQGGTPCFTGTRVPVRSLFDALNRGRPIEYFLSQFPTVKKEHTVAVLEQPVKIAQPTAHGKP
jgi:uncharacterized protein (DUF433 family)